MDFEEVADRLYGVDPEEFVPARTASVAQARAAGDRPLATRIGALKKPTRSGWLVNLLAASDAEGLSTLKELAARVARAHGSADLAALRAVGAERQKLVDGLTRQALAVGSERGYAATDAVRLEVNGTLASAVADPDVLALVLAGRVIKAQVYSGFGFPLGGMAPVAAPAAEPVPAATVATDAPDEEENRDRARQEAQAAMTTATERVIDARSALKTAQSAEEESGAALDRASQEVADLRVELRKAEQAEESARRSASRAADELHDARTTVQQAEQALAEAARSLGRQG